MYRCCHCGDLHLGLGHVQRCAKVVDCSKTEEAERIRLEDRGRVPLWFKKLAKHRRWTPDERALNASLRKALPGIAVKAQWWLDECDFMVDFLIPAGRIVIEVDGSSHQGREGPDRFRARQIRSYDYEIVRVSAAEVMADADGVAASIAELIGGTAGIHRPDPADAVGAARTLSVAQRQPFGG